MHIVHVYSFTIHSCLLPIADQLSVNKHKRYGRKGGEGGERSGVRGEGRGEEWGVGSGEWGEKGRGRKRARGVWGEGIIPAFLKLFA